MTRATPMPQFPNTGLLIAASPQLRTGYEAGGKAACEMPRPGDSACLISRLALSRDRVKSSQVRLLFPEFHRADSALRSQAAGGVGYSGIHSEAMGLFPSCATAAAHSFLFPAPPSSPPGGSSCFGFFQIGFSVDIYLHLPSRSASELANLGYLRKIISNSFHLPTLRPGPARILRGSGPARGISEIKKLGPSPDIWALLPDTRAGPRPGPVPAVPARW